MGGMSATPRTVLGTVLIAPFLLLTALPAVPALAQPVLPAPALSAVAGAVPPSAAPPVARAGTVADPTAPSVRVNTDGGVVSVRSGPATDKRAMASIGDDTRIAVRCKVWGERVAGTERRTAYWARVGADRYLPDAFLAWPTPRPEVPWCGASPVDAVDARVATGGSVLNVRRDPGTAAGRIGTVDDGRALSVLCQAAGERVPGVADTAVWLRLPGGRYVAEAYVRWSPQRPWLPWCGQEPARVPPASAREFVEEAAAPARAAARAHGVPASLLVAQAVHASDWGRAAPTRHDHNYFGTACAAGAGGGLGCREYAGVALRAYRNRTDSFADHALVLARTPGHEAALRHAGDPERFMRDLQAAGYPGGARYADRIIDLMRRYDLYRLDAAP